ncbi:oleandomycin glycosyltransferase [Catellatospora methionotrophica]|uniref:Oleandomycin glycosyltransferase n=1 Tax=Catellatospora methionotrophica TaxID=121620 RepID=A0A8J3LAH4_9ACTN|nr:macrolide family glycosyltransferase [Catellatospora methionotrophica]GIG12099.1 oleandomycin glycosyltransferase [Catellatospora methionotrophica]
MSAVAFLNIGMHGHINPTLPVVAELVRRGHAVTYHTTPAFAEEVAAAGARVFLYSGDEVPMSGPPSPVTLMEQLARTAVQVLPGVLTDLRAMPPDLIVHDSACLWGPVAARELGVPAVSSFTTFAFGRQVPSPTRASWGLLAAAGAMPSSARGYLRARRELRRRYDTSDVPLIDLADIRQPLNLVYTSPVFHPGANGFDKSYRFVGPSIGARPADPMFPIDSLRDPVLYVSMGTVFDAGPQVLRTVAEALAPLGGTVVVATGHTDPAALGPLPPTVLARGSVPQLEVLSRAALFVTHGGVNSVNESLHAGVPMLAVPQGADQLLVADRIAELGAGLVIRTEDVTVDAVRALARRLLGEPRFRDAVHGLRDAQQHASGAPRAVDELERYLRQTGAARPGPAELPTQG